MTKVGGLMGLIQRLRAWFKRMFGRPAALPIETHVSKRAELAKPEKPRTREGYRLQPGYAWNPLRSVPRNFPCPCRSGKKFKSCHLDRLAPAVEVKEVPRLQSMVRAIENGRLPREAFLPTIVVPPGAPIGEAVQNG